MSSGIDMGARIDAVLRDAVERGDVPAVVAVAADRNGVIYEGAAGPRAAGASDPIGPDSMLRVASMTKMVTTVAALQLAEQGALDLEAPVRAYRPEFSSLQVLTGFAGDEPLLRPPASDATVRHLLTHTSGLSYWFWNADVVRWEAVTGSPNVLSGSTAVFDAPLVADPGTRFEYGISTDWLGRVIEAISGVALDAYVGAHILEPLGMRETTWLMSPEQEARSVPVHRRRDGGPWVATGVDWSRQPEYLSGGHGLYSTARDYLRFQRMLLAAGTFDGVTILAPGTVAAAFANQIGAITVPEVITTAHPASSADFVAGPGRKWGYGLLLTTADLPGRRRAGTGSWAGIFNTHFWVDPAAGITGAVHTQLLPFVDPPAVRVYEDVERALYASS